MTRRMLALAACWVLVNLASVTHTAWSFAQLERAGWWWLVGVVAAVGTDAGMAALTWIAMERRRDGGSLWWPVVGVLLAGAAVAYANVDHALGVAGEWSTLSAWVQWRVVVLSLVLPGLTVLMSALVEHEHAAAVPPALVAGVHEVAGASTPTATWPSRRRGREYSRRRRERMHSSPNFERVSRAVVWDRDGGLCHVCGLPCDEHDWHMDHVVPLARGGEHSYRNVAVSHPLCNLRKATAAMPHNPVAMAERGMPNVEIARLLGVHPSTITRRLAKARNGALAMTEGSATTTAERNGQHASAGEVGG